MSSEKFSRKTGVGENSNVTHKAPEFRNELGSVHSFPMG